jgi:hypothetical protein
MKQVNIPENPLNHFCGDWIGTDECIPWNSELIRKGLRLLEQLVRTRNSIKHVLQKPHF